MRTNTRNLRRGLALTATVFVLAAPVAVAEPIEPVGPSPGGERQAAAYSAPPVELPAAPAPSTADGFDWGDAGIGASVVVALAALAAGAAISSGHRQRGRHTVA